MLYTPLANNLLLPHAVSDKSDILFLFFCIRIMDEIYRQHMRWNGIDVILDQKQLRKEHSLMSVTWHTNKKVKEYLINEAHIS